MKNFSEPITQLLSQVPEWIGRGSFCTVIAMKIGSWMGTVDYNVALNHTLTIVSIIYVVVKTFNELKKAQDRKRNSQTGADD